MSTPSFPCTSCSACCRTVKQTVARAKKDEIPNKKLQAYVLKFPHGWDEKGACDQLKDDGTCSVYETRPEICRIDLMTEKCNDPDISIEEHYKARAGQCNALQVNFNIDKSYRVNYN